MFYMLNWFVVFALFALWSFAAWAFHSVAVWMMANAGSLSGGAGAIESLQLPVWLAPWVPSEYVSSVTLVISSVMPAIQTALEWAPAMAGGLAMAVWIVWGIGAFVLIALGLLATGLIAMVSRKISPSMLSSRNMAVAR